MGLSKAEEDYVKFIYEHSLRAPFIVKISDIAKAFSFTEQSVNQMVKQLEEKALLTFIPYKSITLTVEGTKAALLMIRAHRVWETFLTTQLNYPWDQVHAVCEQLEHQGDALLIDRLDTFLNHPSTCPHGNPIPTSDLTVQTLDYQRLDELTTEQTFVIRQVSDHPILLSFLSQYGIQLGSHLTLVNKDTFNELLELKHQDQVFKLSMKNATYIFGTLIQH